MASTYYMFTKFIKWYDANIDDIRPTDEVISSIETLVNRWKPGNSDKNKLTKHNWCPLLKNATISQNETFVLYLFAELTNGTDTPRSAQHIATRQHIANNMRHAFQLYLACRSYYPHTLNPMDWLLRQSVMRSTWVCVVHQLTDPIIANNKYVQYMAHMCRAFPAGLGQLLLKSYRTGIACDIADVYMHITDIRPAILAGSAVQLSPEMVYAEPRTDNAKK